MQISAILFFDFWTCSFGGFYPNQIGLCMNLSGIVKEFCGMLENVGVLRLALFG